MNPIESLRDYRDQRREQRLRNMDPLDRKLRYLGLSNVVVAPDSAEGLPASIWERIDLDALSDDIERYNHEANLPPEEQQRLREEHAAQIEEIAGPDAALYARALYDPEAAAELDRREREDPQYIERRRESEAFVKELEWQEYLGWVAAMEGSRG